LTAADTASKILATNRDIVITGIPRSGTTLLSALLNNPPSSVSIGEPRWHGKRVRDLNGDAEAFADWLQADFQDVRNKIENGQAIETREALDGGILTNYRAGNEKNFRFAHKTFVVEPKFVLAMKSPVLYTAVLPSLIARGHSVIAIIRNPVATLLSWASVPFPISRGRLPAGERYWPELAAITGSTRPVLERQAMIWELFARRYVESKSAISLLRYEDLVARPQIAGDLAGTAVAQVPICHGMNQNDLYRLEAAHEIKTALRELSPVARMLYWQDLD
jgi:hypothetical protein